MVGGGCLKRGSILLSPIFFRSNIQLGSHLYHNFSMSAIGKREVSKASIVVKIGLANAVNCSLKNVLIDKVILGIGRFQNAIV